MGHLCAPVVTTLCAAILFAPCVFGSNAMLPLSGAVRQQSCETTYQLRLGLSFESSFCAEYGTTFAVAAHMASTVVEQAEKVFLDQVCVQLSIAFIYGFCNATSDPYVAIQDTRNPSRILDEFKNNFKQPSGVAETADLNILFTGVVPRKGFGLAFESSVCSDQAFAVVAWAMTPVLIKEIARALSCRNIELSAGVPHNIMQATTSFIFNVPWLFLPESRVNITSFAASDQGRCMTRTTGRTTHPEPAIFGGTTFSSCAALKPDAKDDLYKGSKRSIMPTASRLKYRIKIRQKKNALRVTFKGISNVITEISFRLSSVPLLGPFVSGELRTFGDGKKVIKFKVPYESIIPTENSPTSCCGQIVYIYCRVTRCDANRCSSRQTQVSRVAYTIKCKK